MSSPEFWLAIFAGVTLVILWTASILGLASWIGRQFSFMRADFDAKHLENSRRWQTVNDLVIRHDTILRNRSGNSRPHG